MVSRKRAFYDEILDILHSEGISSKHLTSYDAYKLIDDGLYVWDVMANLEKFVGLDHNEIAHRLIDTGRGYAFSANLRKFTSLDVGVARKLINQGLLLDVVRSVHIFDVSVSEIILGCIDQIKADANTADNILKILSDCGMSADVQRTVLWVCVAHYSIAQKVAQLDLEALIGEEEAAKLRAHIAELKPELHVVAKHNPYADKAGDMEHVTSSRPGTEFHRRAVEVGRRLRHPETDEDRELVAIIQRAYDTLRKEFAMEHGEQYTKELFGGRGDKTGDAWPTYRRLVADYIAAMSDKFDLAVELEHAALEFHQVLSFDVNYYDKLFREWDAKRIGERGFEEVFLGRDGVYAYVGRQAQLYARRRKLGMSSREAGGSSMEFPSYLAYPRGFCDGLDDETKSVYLHSQIKRPKAAHYHDTGFIGTIPDDIMRVLGVAEEYRDSQIRLLGADKRPRTVLGVKDDRLKQTRSSAL